MDRTGSNERGAALVTVMLFMTLTFILISTMLVSTGNEATISAFHRDGIRALDLAQAGVQEAVQRLQAGRPINEGSTFTSSINPAVTVAVKLPVAAGPSAVYREVQVTAIAGKATRRLSFMVLQESKNTIPNMFMGDSLRQPGNPNQIQSGDVYSRSFVQYQDQTPDPNSLTYAAWRASLCNDVNCSGIVPGDGQINFCYTSPCAGAPNWYPGTRRTEFASTALGTDIQAQTTKCAAGGGGSLPPDQITGTTVNEATSTYSVYGFDLDTRGGVNRAVSSKLPCGLPYKLVSVTFPKENGTNVTRLVKTTVFEQWFDNYWQFNESQMNFVKNSALTTYPDLGAVPPFPDNTMDRASYDVQLTGGGAAVPPAGQNFGTVSQVKTVWMDNHSWQITDSTPGTGYGTMVVDGNLDVNILSGQNFEYWGTIIVKGTLRVDSGQLIVHGGLIARNLIVVNGNFTLYGGGSIASVPAGQSTIVGKTWWER